MNNREKTENNINLDSFLQIGDIVIVNNGDNEGYPIENALPDGTELRVKVAHIEDMMRQAEMYAAYWNAMATSGAAKLRQIRKGGMDGELMSPEELTAEALDTALRHIHKFNELIDDRIGAQNMLFELERRL